MVLHVGQYERSIIIWMSMVGPQPPLGVWTALFVFDPQISMI